jgi:hypothetical protein
LFAFRNVDAVVGNLAKNFAEGTEYFKVCEPDGWMDGWMDGYCV